MKKIIGMFVLFASLLSAAFIGCGDNPALSPDGDDDGSFAIDSTKASIVLVSSTKLSDGSWEYQLRATGFFYPSASSPILVGLQNDWTLGVAGHKAGDNVWDFLIRPANGDKLVNFRDGDNWAQLGCLRNTGYYQVSPQGGNLAIHFENGQISKVGGSTVIINGKDTIRIIDTVFFGDFVKTEGAPIDMGNGYWRNTYLFSSRIIFAPDTSYHPFAIGLPSWNSKDSLRYLGPRRADGYYPLVATLKDGRIPFCVGGDFKRNVWADSATLANSFWGKLTPGGEIMELVQIKGRVYPGSLIDTTTVPPVVHDTVKVIVRDTTIKVVRDTIKIPGKTIVDTLFIIQINNRIDTVHIRDTITNVIIVVKRDTVTIPGKTIHDTLWINTVTHDTIHVRDTVVNTIIVVKKDTVTIPGAVIHDTLRINIVTHDTVHTKDTVYLSVTIIDKGTVVDSTKDFLRDTSWVDADSLKGIITEDTIVGVRSIHSYLIVSAKGDTTPKADTSTVSNKIYRYRADTVSFVIMQYGVTAVGADTVYRFGAHEKLFAYGGRIIDSASLTGLDKSKWAFAGKIGKYFVFDAKLVGGTTYKLNSYGYSAGTSADASKWVWAKQEILELSPFAVRDGTNLDLVVKGGGILGLVKP